MTPPAGGGRRVLAVTQGGCGPTRVPTPPNASPTHTTRAENGVGMPSYLAAASNARSYITAATMVAGRAPVTSALICDDRPAVLRERG